MGSIVKTTVELPDDLYRQAKAEAALGGRKIRDLIEEGLRMVVDRSKRTPRAKNLLAMMKRANGVIDSGVNDLGSNAGHLEGFGRNDRRHS
jgi:hypothetical protein